MTTYKMGKQLIQSRFSKAANSYHKAAIVQRQIAEKMMVLMQNNIPLKQKVLLEIGCGTGIFSRLLSYHIQSEKMILNDICPEMEMEIMDIINENNTFICGDAEVLSLPKKIDIIASCSTIQWFENLNTFFENCHNSLNNGGFLVFSIFGKENMKEINTLTRTALTYPFKLELESKLVSLNFEILYSEEEIISTAFDTPLGVLQHLKQTGVTGVKSQFWTKGKLENFLEEYHSRFSNGTSVSLTYHPIYIIAKKKMK